MSPQDVAVLLKISSLNGQEWFQKSLAESLALSQLNKIIVSEEAYVWPSAKGSVRGSAIVPLYDNVVKAVERDPILYELLALVDALRVGRVREKKFAIEELNRRLGISNHTSNQ